jgi:hypothetical protein
VANTALSKVESWNALVNRTSGTQLPRGLVGRIGVQELSDQEKELLSLIRGDNAQELTLTITFKGGRWYVGLHVPGLSRQRSDGEGATFNEAWDDIKPSWI